MARHEILAEGVELWCGDMLDILPTLGEFDACVTDPPYGIGFPYESYQDTRENLRLLIRGLFASRNQFQRMAILCGPSQIHEFPSADWVGAVTWNTTGSFGKFGYSQWTPILLYGSDLPGFGNVNGVTKSDTYHISGGGSVGFQRQTDETLHTCSKPMNIMLRVIQRFTPNGSHCIDPFLGSGSTGVAAVTLGRRFTGIEIEPKYFDIALRRISEALKAPDLFIPTPKPAAKQEQLL